ncbi:MAG: hypothetical protein M0Z55_04085 [Peptococcaceae bacterium]|nr:hypothetical protein [Peptococcaceae bacterium]
MQDSSSASLAEHYHHRLSEFEKLLAITHEIRALSRDTRTGVLLEKLKAREQIFQQLVELNELIKPLEASISDAPATINRDDYILSKLTESDQRCVMRTREILATILKLDQEISIDFSGYFQNIIERMRDVSAKKRLTDVYRNLRTLNPRFLDAEI